MIYETNCITVKLFVPNNRCIDDSEFVYVFDWVEQQIHMQWATWIMCMSGPCDSIFFAYSEELRDSIEA